MASTKRLDLFVTSGKSKQDVIRTVDKYLKKRDNLSSNFDYLHNKIYAHYADITYFRDMETIEKQKAKDNNDSYIYPISGDKQMLFGDDSLKLMPTLKNKSEDVINKSEFVNGFTRDVLVDSSDGSKIVNIYNPKGLNYNVFLQNKGKAIVEPRVEIKELNSFKMICYDADAYGENGVAYDCSLDNVLVEFVVVYI